jgi:hypothetical protein
MRYPTHTRLMLPGRLAWLLVLLPIAGCLDDLPSPNEVTNLRILAIVAGPPEAAAGDNITLEALVIDAQARDIAIEWRVCLSAERLAGFAGGNGSTQSSGGRGFGLDDPGTCFPVVGEALESEFVDIGTGTTASFVIPENFLDDTETILGLYGISADASPQLTAAAGLLLAIAGVNLNVAIRATAGDEVRVGFKRLNISTAAAKNVNPIDLAFDIRPDADDTEPEPTAEPPIDNRCFVGEPGARVSLAVGKHTITALNVPDPHVTYEVLVGGEDLSLEPSDQCTIPIPGCQVRDENYFYSFFSTVGGFGSNIVKSSGDGAVEWEIEADKVPENRIVPLWIVVRDGRGGTGWCHSEVEIF